MGREDIDGFDKKVTAKGVFVQLNMTNLSSEVRRVFVEAMRKISADQQLAYSETGFTNISQQNLGDILRTITTQ